MNTLLIVSINICCLPIYAVLGESPEPSVDNPNLTKTVYSIKKTTNNLISIQEQVYNGKIFSVEWKGIQHPDLKNLLGKYFNDYRDSASKTPRIKGMRIYRRVIGNKVIVETVGNSRQLEGRAYVPSLAPQSL